MNVQLDPGFLRTSMNLWRAATDMTIPVHDSFKIHFMERRGSLLQGFSDTGRLWSMMLGACTPSSDADRAEFEELKADIQAFKDWADKSLQDLRDLKEAE